jgi:hypothetical protein
MKELLPILKEHSQQMNELTQKMAEMNRLESLLQDAQLKSSSLTIHQEDIENNSFFCNTL